MTTPRLRFVSRNTYKLAEAKAILDPLGVAIVPVERAIEELQTEDPKLLVRDKALKAFEYLGEPLFVEHTGLYLDYLNGLPGGLTQIVWDRLEADRFAQLFGTTDDKVLARTVIGQWTERSAISSRVKYQEGYPPSRVGHVAFSGIASLFQKVLTRRSRNQGQEKEISMRKQALDKFAGFLRR